ncbi:hypothetical protein BVY00_01465 [bacterium G20]|nr:hypothetical protein BVY00_01465 [bacterium G20]
MKKITVAYHNPYPDTIYAARYVFLGFQNAFSDMDHNFVVFSPGQDLGRFLDEHKPQLFITASHFFYRKFLDYELLKRWRQSRGLVLLTKIDFWDSPLNKNRINEAPSMKDDKEAKRLIKAGLLGDHYFHMTAQSDGRMSGFAEFAGQDFITIPLAANPHTLKPVFTKKFEADISFIGTNLPQKRQYFKQWLFPLGDKYDLKLYGQDWTLPSRLLGLVTKGGQYFNLPVIKSLQKPPLKLGEEANIYASSKILVNIHEDYQRRFGGDCNERTFKIPYCGGFEICDDVAVVRDYFKEGEEIVIATSKDDWFDKIDYYFNHPLEAKKIAEAGRQKVLDKHLYKHRAQQMLDLLK